MDWNEKLPEWNQAGAEPPQQKKDTGWQIEERPPAGWFNWLFNRAYKCLDEIRTVLGGHVDAASPHTGHETPTGAQAKVDTHENKAAPHTGHETPAGAQAKADAAESAANSYTDQEVGDLAGDGRTTETVKGNADALDAHLADNNNPHGVTKAQVGLGNVDNIKQVPITRKINNKELSQDITLSASDVGAAPSSHVGSGGSAHATATTSTAGFMSAADKTKLNKLRSVDDTVYGSVTYTDTVAAESTLRKTIAIGSGKTEGKAVITPKNHGGDGVLVFFTTDATRTYAVGGARISSGRTGGALRQDIAGFVTSGGSTLIDGVGYAALGNMSIGITNMYISGSSIIIDFYNRDTSPEQLNCIIAWEVR